MIKYKVIDDKGMVKAFLYDTEMDVYNKIVKEWDKVEGIFKLNLLRKSYSAQAKVNPEYDEFDTEIGKRIAKDRLLVKYYTDRISSTIEIVEFYEKYVELLMTMIRKDFNKRADYVRDLQELGVEV